MAVILVHGGVGDWPESDRDGALQGVIGVVHGTQAMPHAFRNRAMAAVTARFSLR